MGGRGKASVDQCTNLEHRGHQLASYIHANRLTSAEIIEVHWLQLLLKVKSHRTVGACRARSHQHSRNHPCQAVGGHSVG